MRDEGRPPHLILVGLAGSGKSTVGRALAERLGRPFVDLDEEIIRREGTTVGEIFRGKGEAYFRSLERQLTEELSQSSGKVIAPGAGWMMTPGVPEIVRPPARVVYLRVRPETAFARVGSHRVNRPLLDHDDPLGELKRQIGRRGATYETADLVVDSEVLDLQQVVNLIVKTFGA